jgi:hypothetical protein
MNGDHLLAEAKRSALAMVAEGYQPPLTETIYAAGRDVLAALHAAVWGMEQAGWATAHDALVANKIGRVLCGGDLTEPTWVPEQAILDLEREAFVDLCRADGLHASEQQAAEELTGEGAEGSRQIRASSRDVGAGGSLELFALKE